MFAEINKEALASLPFVLSTLGESVPRQLPIHHAEGNSFHEIIWIRRGEGLFRLNGSLHILTEGQGVVIRCGVPHAYEGEDFVTAWITFRGGDGIFDFCGLPDYRVFRVPPFLEKRYTELDDLCHAGSTPLTRASATLSCVTELLGEICTPREPVEAMVESFMEARYNEALTLEEIAAFAQMDRFALCRYWRRVRGHGVMADLYRIRVEKAKRFLRYTTDTVEQIGKNCGFDSPSYFAKRFREMTGTTPVEYRRSHRG